MPFRAGACPMDWRLLPCSSPEEEGVERLLIVRLQEASDMRFGPTVPCGRNRQIFRSFGPRENPSA